MRVLPGRPHRTRGALVALAMGVPLILSLPGAAVADHPAPGFVPFDGPIGSEFNSGT